MKNHHTTSNIKNTFLLFLFTIINIQIAFSQCINPVPTGSTSQTFCETSNSTVSNLVAQGGNIVWYNAPTGGSLYNPSDLLVNSTVYYADDISGGSCSTSRLAVTVSIYGDFPTNTSVFVGKCVAENATIEDLTATGTAIEWYDSQTGGNLLPTTTLLVNGTTYWVQQTENGCTSERLPTTVTIIDPPPPSVAPIQSFCSTSNPTVGSLVATGTNISWYNSQNSTSPLVLTTPLINGNTYWASQTTFPCESTDRAQTTVEIDTPPNAGTDGAYMVCEIDAATTDLFSLLGGTPDLTGSWSGPDTLTNGYLGTFEPGVNAEGVYTYTVASDLGICPNASATVSVTITIIQPPAVSQTNQAFCSIDNPTVADLSPSGSDINWYDTENSITPLNSADALIDGEDYWAAQIDATSSCESKTRVMVGVSINTPLPPTVSQTNQTFCSTDNPTIADLSPSGSGIIWYDSETSTTPLNTSDALTDREDYWAAQTSTVTSCESDVRIVVNISIYSPLPPTISQTNQAFCEIDNPTVADLSPSGSEIVWYDSENSTDAFTGAENLTDGEDYWAAQIDAVSGCESVGREKVTVTVNSTPQPTTINSNQVFCMIDFQSGAPTINDLDISGDGIIWYDTETSTSPLNGTDVLVNEKNYWATQTAISTGCESATRLLITAIISNPPTPTTSLINQSFCLSDNPTVANLMVDSGSALWYPDENATTPLNSSDALEDQKEYWAAGYDAANNCESISRAPVTVTINDIAPAQINNPNQVFCASDKPTIQDLQATGNGIFWFASETDTTPLNSTDELADGEDYWTAQTDAVTGCISSVRVSVNTTLTNPGTPMISSQGNEFCFIDNPTIADLTGNVTPNSGGVITWFDSFPNGNILSNSELLTEGVTYYAIETDTDNNCKTTNPLAVTVTLNSCEQYDVIIYDGFSPNGNGINDTFKVGNLRELYPNFKIEFFNRWGALIYTANASNNDWNGRLNGHGELVPTGVYYYIIYFNKNDRKPIQRRLYLSR